jgi:WXG100 family type VII secretion target
MKLGVQSEELRTEAQHVQTGAADVGQILGKLSTEITNLASNWNGDAYDAFLGHWQHWQQGAEQIRNAMDEMSTFLTKAAAQYEETEHAIKSAAGN